MLSSTPRRFRDFIGMPMRYPTGTVLSWSWAGRNTEKLLWDLKLMAAFSRGRSSDVVMLSSSREGRSSDFVASPRRSRDIRGEAFPVFPRFLSAAGIIHVGWRHHHSPRKWAVRVTPFLRRKERSLMPGCSGDLRFLAALQRKGRCRNDKVCSRRLVIPFSEQRQ